MMGATVGKTAEYFVRDEPYYAPQAGEIEPFEAAYRNRIPVLLKGANGCGKTRFGEHMAQRLLRPLTTVSCHDDLTAADLVGRYLIVGGGTSWIDGPLAHAARAGNWRPFPWKSQCRRANRGGPPPTAPSN